jgi:hypothetical protein
MPTEPNKPKKKAAPKPKPAKAKPKKKAISKPGSDIQPRG